MAKDEKNKKSKNMKEQKSSFFKDSKAELKKVIWPTPKSLVNDTAIVVGIVLIVAIIVVILDFLFLYVNENVILEAEKKVRNNNQNSITTDINSIIEQTETQDNKQEQNSTGEQENTENEVNTEGTEKQEENTENDNAE